QSLVVAVAGNPYVWLAAVVAVIAAGLLIAGIRGRAVPPRRVCRRCGYEVGEQAVCPESGRDLGGRRGARGVRRRGGAGVGGWGGEGGGGRGAGVGGGGGRGGWVGGGVGGAGALVLAGATLGVLAARGVDLNRYKPLGLLLWEAQSVDVQTADAAAEEL